MKTADNSALHTNNITMAGGSLEVESASGNAIIGSSVTIQGGTVKATGSAGIGCSDFFLSPAGRSLPTAASTASSAIKATSPSV